MDKTIFKETVQSSNRHGDKTIFKGTVQSSNRQVDKTIFKGTVQSSNRQVCIYKTIKGLFILVIDISTVYLQVDKTIFKGTVHIFKLLISS